MGSAITVPTACARAFAGTPDSVWQARAWVREVLPNGCGRVDDVLLVVSELATNAVIHSASGAPGGRYALQLEVDPHARSVGVTCIDMGPSLVKAVRPAGEGGRGLALISELVDGYDVIVTETDRTVWCRLEWPTAANGDGGPR